MESRNVFLLKSRFSNARMIIEKIKRNKHLSYFFANGACGQLSKILYKYFSLKGKDQCKLLCFVTKPNDIINDNIEFILNSTEEDFLKKYAILGICHVALILNNEVYDYSGVVNYDENYEHNQFRKENYSYKLINLKNLNSSKIIFKEILFAHKYGNLNESEVVGKIL